MMKKIGTALAAALLGLALCPRASADSWPLPEPQKYYSPNKAYYVEVLPRKLESQLKFFDDKVKRKEPAGSAGGMKENYCKGIFYRRNAGGEYEKVWESRLSNDVAPVHAVVSDGGEYFVTFDNWHSVGFGDDVVVIYGQGGKIIREMSLEDIFGKDSNVRLPRSVSSVYWGRGHYIDEEKQTLVLRVITDWGGSVDEVPKYRDVRVDLKTGQMIGEPQVAGGLTSWSH